MHHWTTHSGYKIIRVLSFRCNAFLISNGVNNILVDCGSKRYRKQLVWSLAKLGIGHINALILTHSHFDHAGNSHYIQNRFGTSVFIHRNEADRLKWGITPIPGGTTILTRFLVRYFGKFAAPMMAYQPCQANLTISDKYRLESFGFNGYILHTPGHSIGSVSIIIDDEIVLAGDAIFGIKPDSVFPPYAEDVTLLIKSWKILIDTGAILFMPSHGRPRTLEVLKKCYLERTTDNK
jgi:glyoxylase-like metal-dependent hydrolase (beta-lactamase superfamily II)